MGREGITRIFWRNKQPFSAFVRRRNARLERLQHFIIILIIAEIYLRPFSITSLRIFFFYILVSGFRFSDFVFGFQDSLFKGSLRLFHK